MEDADLDEASSLAAAGSYKNSGQRCTAVKRMLVQKSVADRFVDLLLDKTRAWRHGDTADRQMQMGTVIAEHAACTFEERRSEEYTSALQSLMRVSYALLPLNNKHHFPI